MSASNSKRLAIAARLALARKQAGLSQAQVAKMLGLHRPSISEAEAGRRRISAEELTKLANIYGVSINWLACSDTESVDVERDRLLLAARALTKLKKGDLNKVIDLLVAIRKPGGRNVKG